MAAAAIRKPKLKTKDSSSMFWAKSGKRGLFIYIKTVVYYFDMLYYACSKLELNFDFDKVFVRLYSLTSEMI